MPGRAHSLHKIATFWYWFYIIFIKYFGSMAICLMNVKTFFNIFMWRHCIRLDEISIHSLLFTPKWVFNWFLSGKITKIVKLKKCQNWLKWRCKDLAWFSPPNRLWPIVWGRKWNSGEYCVEWCPYWGDLWKKAFFVLLPYF